MGNATSELRSPASVAQAWPQAPAAEVVLAARPARPISLVHQNLALQGLARALARSHDNVLQQLVESALTLCGAQSAGVSLIEYDGTDKVFRWHAVAGRWSPYLMGSMPRNASPCGIVVDRHAAQVMPTPELYFPAMLGAEPLATEALLVPFDVMGETVGTVWVVSHDDTRFAADDLRMIACLSDFAAAAYLMQTTVRRMIDEREELDRALVRLRRENERLRGSA